MHIGTHNNKLLKKPNEEECRGIIVFQQRIVNFLSCFFIHVAVQIGCFALNNYIISHDLYFEVELTEQFNFSPKETFGCSDYSLNT